MKPKQYSLSYWCKQNLRSSNPEAAIAQLVNAHAAGSELPVYFSGSALELANALYIEWKKRASVQMAFFPTPLPVAQGLAKLAGVRPGDIVFDPGCGFGNLLHAARACGARAFGCEIQWWLTDLAPALGLKIQRGDFLDGYKPGFFTHVLANPPFGRMQDRGDIATAFLHRLADHCPAGTPVAIILPAQFLSSSKPKDRVAAIDRFEIQSRIPLPPDTFAPLTHTATEMALLIRKEQSVPSCKK